MSIVKLISYALTAFLQMAPLLGVHIDPMLANGLSALLLAVVGLLTQGIGKTAESIFASVTGFVPALTLLIQFLFHIEIGPPTWNAICAFVAVVIAKVDNAPDISTFMKNLALPAKSTTN